MKFWTFCFGLMATLFGCGYSSKDNELIGQVKKVKNKTPIICSDYVAAESGQLVKVKYDSRRVTLCVPDYWVTSVEVVK